ncbi:MAG: O-antigen ligase family protein [Chitinophagaceae bacterium]
MIAVLLLGAIIYGYLLVMKPHVVAILFFTITIADVNFEMGGLPLNIRAIIGLTLFARTIVSGKNEGDPGFFMNAKTWLIMVFTLYGITITAFNDLLNADVIKTAALTLISMYCGWYYFFQKGNMSYLRTALIIAGFICFFDLVFTYGYYGQFPVQRIYQFLLKVPIPVDEKGEFVEVINHNFYGLICGMGFVYLLNEFINKESPNKSVLLILPVMFLGVLMSTSRSTLLGLIIVSVVLITRELRHRERAKKAYTLIGMAVGIVFICLFAFTTLQSYLNVDSEFMERIMFRLVDEPMAVLNKHMGMNYNVQSLEAMDWREEASKDAFNAWLNLPFGEQIFGIGYWGFVVRDLGHSNLPPHNGILFLLFDSGMIGLAMYFFLILTIIRRSLIINTVIPPLVTTLLFVIFYCLGQNGELTSSITFLFVITLIAENEQLMQRLQAKTPAPAS